MRLFINNVPIIKGIRRKWEKKQVIYLFFFSSSYCLLFHCVVIFSLQARSILERHLVIADKVFTMAELRSMGHNDTIVLPTIRDSLTIRVKEDDKREYNFTKLLCLLVFVFVFLLTLTFLEISIFGF